MNRRGFLRFFGAMPAALATTAIAPVTYAEVDAVASVAHDAMSRSIASAMEAADLGMRIDFAESSIKRDRASRVALSADIYRVQNDIGRALEPLRVARLVSEPPKPVMLVYAPEEEETAQ